MIPRLSDLHESPELLDRAATPIGQSLVWLLATVLLTVLGASLLMPMALGAVMLLPERRRSILSVAAAGTLLGLLLARFGVQVSTFALFAGVLATLVVAVLLLDRLRVLPGPVRRHPVLAIHLATWAALCTATAFPALGLMIGNGISPFLWRLSYLAQYMASPGGSDRRLRDHLFYLARPVWGGSNVPYGKGLAYLSKCEARDSTAAARAQLAGIKLLCLALLWTWSVQLMDAFVYGAERIEVLDARLRGADLPKLHEILSDARADNRAIAWSSVFLDLIRRTLKLAAAGHLIIGSLRLLGYNVFRNTYKPLLAESIVDFWNRYYYYFKELLVEFFFYPAFFAARQVPARLRLLLAVFAAAFFGNMYYHVLGRPELIVAGDITALWDTWGPRTVYCFFLAVGVWASMIRRQINPPSIHPGVFVRMRRIAGVWTYFGLINIFNGGPSGWTISERLDVVRYLFGFG